MHSASAASCNRKPQACTVIGKSPSGGLTCDWSIRRQLRLVLEAAKHKPGSCGHGFSDAPTIVRQHGHLQLVRNSVQLHSEALHSLGAEDSEHLLQQLDMPQSVDLHMCGCGGQQALAVALWEMHR